LKHLGGGGSLPGGARWPQAGTRTKHGEGKRGNERPIDSSSPGIVYANEMSYLGKKKHGKRGQRCNGGTSRESQLLGREFLGPDRAGNYREILPSSAFG